MKEASRAYHTLLGSIHVTSWQQVHFWNKITACIIMLSPLGLWGFTLRSKVCRVFLSIFKASKRKIFLIVISSYISSHNKELLLFVSHVRLRRWWPSSYFKKHILLFYRTWVQFPALNIPVLCQEAQNSVIPALGHRDICTYRYSDVNTQKHN